MNRIVNNNLQDIGDCMRGINIHKNSEFMDVSSTIGGDGCVNNGGNTYFASPSTYSRVINYKPSSCYNKGDEIFGNNNFNYNILKNNDISSEMAPNRIRVYNANSNNYDYYYCKDGAVLNGVNNRLTVENSIDDNKGFSKTLEISPGTGITGMTGESGNLAIVNGGVAGITTNSTTGQISGTGFVTEPQLRTSQFINKSKSSQIFGISSIKNNTSTINNSSWKEWNSYSKLLPLAVVELDVQNECNYLSNLFNSFSNTIKGFISSIEFEKLMDYVNIIEVGYRGTIFNVMDRNQDEYITEVEFLTGMLIFRPYNTKERNAKSFNKLRLQFIFFYYDSNRDGVLSIDELAKLIEHISIIKVTISSDKTRKRTHISSDKSKKLAKQIINDYLNKMYCSYDDFYLIVNNGVLNGTVNLLRCRNDIFIQKNSSSPIKLNHHNNNSPKDPKTININTNNSHFQSPQSFVNNIYNTPLSESVEHINKNDNQTTKLSYISPYSNVYDSFNRSTVSYNNQNVGDHNNLNNIDNNLNYSPNIYNISTPNHTNINSINSTITRKNNQILSNNLISPINNTLYTPDPLSNYRSTFGSASPYYNIPSEGHTNIKMSPYYR
ncbi:erythrocyte membrane-associated antigen [Cryptosporidium xiaoi]|uniref:Erythrocyte membrane-associated antigen n=1 Tax=Cryptosporidium xiaoi TaxID=659607 RepID=A0AAV9XUT5_9CRYT